VSLFEVFAYFGAYVGALALIAMVSPFMLYEWLREELTVGYCVVGFFGEGEGARRSLG
jgi:hypothetical protein